MENFFRTVVYVSLILIVFNLLVVAVGNLNVFPVEGQTAIDNPSTGNILEQVSGWEGMMSNLWLLVITLGGGAALGAAWLTHSPTPIGIYLFGVIFWTSYKHAVNVFTLNPHFAGSLSGFILIATIGMIFLFIAAVIGMLTGS